MLRLTDKVLGAGPWNRYTFHIAAFKTLYKDPLRLFDTNGGDMVLYSPSSQNRWTDGIITGNTTLAELLEIEPTIQKIMCGNKIVWMKE